MTTTTLVPLEIATDQVRLEFDRRTGVLQRLAAPSRGIELVQEPRLAENWRLLVPLPDRRHNYLEGRDCPLIGHSAEGNHLELRWRVVDAADGVDIEITQRWEVVGPRISVVTTLQNSSEHVVEEVLSPALGGLRQAERPEAWRIHHGGPLGRGEEWPVFTDFPGTYLGPSSPVWLLPYHTKSGIPWVDLYDADRRQGVYLGIHDPVGAHAVFTMQLHPGSNYLGDRQVWPDPAVLGDDVPVGATAGWASFPFAAPGSAVTTAPTVIEFHDGTWYRGAELFRTWWDQHFRVADPSWLVDEDAWQSTIISYPDGTIEYRYRDLPRLARAAKEAGIGVIQVCGWHLGGLDRNYPTYDPDPRLGTLEELKQAIAECQAMGVRVLMFGNLQVANIETDEFDPELRRYAIMDPRGFPHNTVSWDYNTTSGLEGLSGYRMHWMNPAHEAFRTRFLDEMRKLIDLGADGIQVDKVLGGGFHGMDYNPEAPGTPATTLAFGLQEAMRELAEAGRQANPAFALAAESHWDRIVQTTNAAYARYFMGDHLPTFSVIFPEYKQTCCVTGPHDFGLVNNAIRFGHIISLEPRCMHGDATDVPVLAPYVSEALSVRRRLRDRIWNSRIVDPAGWSVSEPCHWTIHEGVAGQTSLVINHFERESVDATIAGEAAAGMTAEIHAPFEEVRRVTLPCTVSIPPDRFVVVALTPDADRRADGQ